jgi:hypothetical protein
VAICDVDSKNGEGSAVSITKEYGKDRAIFIKTDVTKKQHLEGQLIIILVIVQIVHLSLPTIIYTGAFK